MNQFDSRKLADFLAGDISACGDRHPNKEEVLRYLSCPHMPRPPEHQPVIGLLDGMREQFNREIGNILKLVFPEVSRAEAINGHLAKDHRVCHYGINAAKNNEIVYFEAPDTQDLNKLSEFYRDLISRYSRLENPPVYIVVLPDSSNESGAKNTAHMHFLELKIAAEFCGGIRELQEMSVERLREIIRNLPDKEKYHANILYRNNLAVQNGKTPDPKDFSFVFAMHQHYDKDHPRFAPHAALVITNSAELTRVINNQPKQVAGIHARNLPSLAKPFLPPDQGGSIDVAPTPSEMGQHEARIEGWPEGLFEHLVEISKNSSFYLPPIKWP